MINCVVFVIVEIISLRISICSSIKAWTRRKDLDYELEIKSWSKKPAKYKNKCKKCENVIMCQLSTVNTCFSIKS